jgi:hypothetical protein
MAAKTIQLKLWISQYASKHAEGGIGYMVTGYKPESTDLVVIGEQSIDFEIPADFNPVAAQVESLKKHMDKLADDYHQERAAIQSRINDLLCLEAPKEGAR